VQFKSERLQHPSAFTSISATRVLRLVWPARASTYRLEC
jgi:hypothetical protein